jgi:hypothetical protein
MGQVVPKERKRRYENDALVFLDERVRGLPGGLPRQCHNERRIFRELDVEREERYWLIAQRASSRSGYAWEVWDFVHSEVPLGDDTVQALEIFTSLEAVEAEKRGMDRLASDAYLDAVDRYGEEATSRMFDSTEPAEVVSLSRSELVSMLDGSSLMYVIVDPLPGDQPQPGTFATRLAWDFAEELRDG